MERGGQSQDKERFQPHLIFDAIRSTAQAMPARIYQRPKNAMQSGKGKTDDWVLEHEPETRRTADPLMGWIGSADTQAQVRLVFASREEAVAYAEREGIPHVVELPQKRVMKPKAYSDNFRAGRAENWTH